MSRIKLGLMVLAWGLFGAAALRAEIRFEDDDEASNVVVGKVDKVETRTEALRKGGVMTRYRFSFKVDKVEKGDGIKAGDTIYVKGYAITKRPGGGFVGAFGQRLRSGKKDEFRPFVPQARQQLKLLLNGSEKNVYRMLYPYGARPIK